MKTGDLRRLLLDLAGLDTRADPERLAACSASDWQRMQAMAEMHRLGPWLHWHHKDNAAIPGWIAETWREAYRQSAMAVLVWQAELGECVTHLRKAGFAPVALKGAYLAAHAYPEPALRPMRDLDLILPREEVLPAFELLSSLGYTLAEPPTMALEDSLRLDKHLPLMIAPRGTALELHSRLSQPEGRLDLDAPHVDEAVLLDRAIEADGVAYPVPEDMLAHLIVHAVYGHRLDCGPLVLSDIEFLTRRHEFDWAAFWQRATGEGWQDGARLLFDLVRHYHGGEAIARSDAEPDAPPAAILEVVPDLLLQDLASRRSAKVLGALMSGNFSLLRDRITGKVTAEGEAGASHDRTREGGLLRWLFRQAGEALTRLASGDVRAQSRHYNRLRRWLEN